MQSTKNDLMDKRHKKSPAVLSPQHVDKNTSKLNLLKVPRRRFKSLIGEQEEKTRHQENPLSTASSERKSVRANLKGSHDLTRPVLVMSSTSESDSDNNKQQTFHKSDSTVTALNIHPRRRKTRSERNKDRRKKRSKTEGHKDKQERTDFKRHIQMAQNIMKNPKVYHGKSATDITQNRLTRKLGLFNKGKASATLGRGDIHISDRLKAETEQELRRILDHSDQGDHTATRSHAPVSSIIPQDVRAKLSISKPHASAGSRSHSDNHSLSLHSTPAVGGGMDVDTSLLYRSQSPHKDSDSMPSSPAWSDIAESFSRSLDARNLFPGTDFFQETKDELNRLFRLNAPVVSPVRRTSSLTKTPRSAPILTMRGSKSSATVTRGQSDSSQGRGGQCYSGPIRPPSNPPSMVLPVLPSTTNCCCGDACSHHNNHSHHDNRSHYDHAQLLNPDQLINPDPIPVMAHSDPLHYSVDPPPLDLISELDSQTLSDASALLDITNRMREAQNNQRTQQQLYQACGFSDSQELSQDDRVPRPMRSGSSGSRSHQYMEVDMMPHGGVLPHGGMSAHGGMVAHSSHLYNPENQLGQQQKVIAESLQPLCYVPSHGRDLYSLRPSHSRDFHSMYHTVAPSQSVEGMDIVDYIDRDMQPHSAHHSAASMDTSDITMVTGSQHAQGRQRLYLSTSPDSDGLPMWYPPLQQKPELNSPGSHRFYPHKLY